MSESHEGSDVDGHEDVNVLQVLIPIYTERCRDSRQKATQYGLLWINIVVLLSTAVGLELKYQWTGTELVLFASTITCIVAFWVMMLVYTHLAHYTQLLYLEELEKTIWQEIGEAPAGWPNRTLPHRHWFGYFRKYLVSNTDPDFTNKDRPTGRIRRLALASRPLLVAPAGIVTVAGVTVVLLIWIVQGQSPLVAGVLVAGFLIAGWGVFSFVRTARARIHGVIVGGNDARQTA